MPAEKITLLPCPFCGSKAVYIYDDGMHWHKGMACRKCSLNIYFFKNGMNVANGSNFGALDEKRAIAIRWNQRANIKVLRSLKAGNKRVIPCRKKKKRVTA